MSKINEEKLLAIIYSNFGGKGKQINDWIYIAEKLKELKKKYKSDGNLAKHLSLSREMVRSTLKLLDLPEEIKVLVKQGKISQDLGWRLLGIKNEKDQVKVSKAIIGLNALDARDMIRFAKNNPEASVEEQIRRLQKSRSLTNKLNLIVLSLNDEEFGKLKEFAKKRNKSINSFVAEIIAEKLKEGA